ncbi:MAG TPA: hypothetical protein VFK47_18900 [Ktedonobacteraceae bacterium]|nr:hypothetical protein [Ktedonobacteraceae bacterium]
MAVVKKLDLAVIVTLAALIFLVSTTLAVLLLIRQNNYRAISKAVPEMKALSSLQSKQPLKKLAACEYAPGKFAQCAALLYPVNAEECASFAKALGSGKSDCAAIATTTVDGRKYTIYAGEYYPEPYGLYIEVILNERVWL